MKNWLAWGLVCAIVMAGLLTAPTLAQFNQRLLTTQTAAGAVCSSASIWNSADMGASVTLSADKCTATSTAASAFSGVRSTPAKNYVAGTGKYYFELTFSTSSGNYNAYSIGGFANGAVALTSYPGSATNGAGFHLNHQTTPQYSAIYYNGAATASGNICENAAPPTMPETIGILVDFADNQMGCTLDGLNFGAATALSPAIGAGPYYIMWSGGQITSPVSNASAKLNTGPTFTINGGTMPTGYVAWN
jgi:hypothetical protein